MAQSKEDKLKYRRDWYRRNLESQKEKERIRGAIRRQDPVNKDKAANNRLLREYGITLNEYNDMYLKQNKVCLLCKTNPNPKRKLHTDHCHKTGIVRGLLCARCNWFMGVVDRDDSILQRMLFYKYFKPETRNELDYEKK